MTNALKSYEYDRGVRKYTAVVVAIIGAFIGSTSTVAIYLGSPVAKEIVRSDPFTGAQGAALIQRINSLEQQVREHVLKHPDEVNQFDRRIATLEAQYAIILQNQGRILDRLDAM